MSCFFRIPTWYFASPMWCGSQIRRGPLSGGMVRSFTKEQLSGMTVEEIYEAINTDLYEDAYERQLKAPKKYRCKRPAEHLETLLFICPACGARDSITSEGKIAKCTCCQHTMEIDAYGMLHGSRFQTVRELSDWQKECLRRDVESNLPYTAEDIEIYEIEKHTETLCSKGRAVMDCNSFTCGDLQFRMSDVTDLAMHDQRAVVFTADKHYYELKSMHSNALKFMLYYTECKSLAKETAPQLTNH